MSKDAVAVSRWWWVRHAPVRENNGRIYGGLDLNCDTSDRAAFQSLATMLPTGARLITSTLKRTTQTAAAIVEAGLALPEPVRDPLLVEQNFGDFQGKTYAEIDADGSGPPGYWLAPGFTRAPNGESFADLMARVAVGITRRIGTDSADPNRLEEDVVAVTHGGTIRAALGIALGLDAERALAFQVDNLSVSRIDRIQTGDRVCWQVVSVNRLPR